MTAVAPRPAGPPADARFEYRVWGEDLSSIAATIAGASRPAWVKVSRETYLSGRTTPLDTNAKLRDGVLDVKHLFDRAEGFERWYPVLKVEFPAGAGDVAAAFDLLGLDANAVTPGTHLSVDFLVEAGLVGGSVTATPVAKHRSGHLIAGCTVEVARVVIARHRTLDTVAVESADLDAAVAAVARFGLDALPNVSYPRLLRSPDRVPSG